MRKASLILSVVGFALSFTFSVPQAWAQPDHLQCHKVKDSIKFKGAVVALESLQQQFQVSANCEIKGRATKLCVPVTKTVVDLGNAPGTYIGPGNDLTPNDYVCYKVKCPKSVIADTLVTDQFDERVLSKIKRSQELCVPAIKGAPATCTEGGDSQACDEYADSDLCAQCCDAASGCRDLCSHAGAWGCANNMENSKCAAAVNATGCADVCCP